MKPIDARIISNKQIASDCYRMQIKPAKPFKPVTPGQFIHIRLTSAPGSRQSFLLRRPFSIYNITDNGNVEIVYQIIGKGTGFMASLKPGAKVDVLGPLGSGFRITGNTVVVVAGGVGAAGLYLLLKELTKRHKDIHLLFGARSKDKLYCLPDLKRLCKNITIATEDGSIGSKGLITVALKRLISNSATRKEFIPPKAGQSAISIYACGPKGMTEAVRQIALTQKIPAQLSLEERMGCGIGFCRACVCKVKNKPDGRWYEPVNGSYRWATVCEEGPVFEAHQLY